MVVVDQRELRPRRLGLFCVIAVIMPDRRARLHRAVLRRAPVIIDGQNLAVFNNLEPPFPLLEPAASHADTELPFLGWIARRLLPRKPLVILLDVFIVLDYVPEYST